MRGEKQNEVQTAKDVHGGRGDKGYMRVGLIDVDGSNKFPNLALMKISSWYKQKGDSVEWYQPLFSGHMDKVYMSKVFSFTEDYPYYIDCDEIVRGGLGTAYLWMKTARKSTTSRKTTFCQMTLNMLIQIMSCTA